MAYTRRPHIPMQFEPDPRPGADAHVYCKGCGHPLDGELRHQPSRVQVTTMMCEACREIHGHALIPKPGTRSFCYRCGAEDEIFIERGTWPMTHHVCPRCHPARADRYRAGNFTAPEPTTS